MIEKTSMTSSNEAISKAPTGIKGLDEITGGGLPKGRVTLFLGQSGVGKTVLAMQILARGTLDYGEPGVFISFEETAEDLAANFASLGYDVPGLSAEGRLILDYIQLYPGAFYEAGKYELEGLLLRITNIVDKIGAKRIVLDGLPALFQGFSDAGPVRAALIRIVEWVKSRNITCIVTAENEAEMARQGIGRTISDCIVLLENIMENNIATRYLSVVKYRGSAHHSDRFPFLITDGGISVLPVTSIIMDYAVSEERLPTGIEALDSMLSGGYMRGSSILISGGSGTGKTSVACHLAAAACERGERCLYYAYEESKSEVFRNMRSIGIDLERWEKQGLLRFHTERVSHYGLESHLVNIEDMLEAFKPGIVIFDPFSDMQDIGPFFQVKGMSQRLIDHLKSRGVTALFTNLSEGDHASPATSIGVSTVMDTWIVLRNHESVGELTRLLYVLKSRGTAHSNRVREFLLTEKGVKLVEVYMGPGGILTGSARDLQYREDGIELENRRRDIEHKKRELENKRRMLQAQIDALQEEIREAEMELKNDIAFSEEEEARIRLRQRMGQQQADKGEAHTVEPG